MQRKDCNEWFGCIGGSRCGLKRLGGDLLKALMVVRWLWFSDML
jgi:hypothetical protein